MEVKYMTEREEKRGEKKLGKVFDNVVRRKSNEEVVTCRPGAEDWA